MPTGTIRSLMRDRGFGFIQTEGASEDVFFHVTALEPGVFDDLKEGQTVEFDLERDPRNPNRQRAANVKIA